MDVKPGWFTEEQITRIYRVKNPIAWVLLALFLFAVYWNYKQFVELGTVCEVILPIKPQTELEKKAQAICYARLAPL